jgi:hypothetical protein
VVGVKIPFMRDPRKPPLHLRPWTPAEVELHRKMMREQERLREIQRRLPK